MFDILHDFNNYIQNIISALIIFFFNVSLYNALILEFHKFLYENVRIIFEIYEYSKHKFWIFIAKGVFFLIFFSNNIQVCKSLILYCEYIHQ